MLVGKHVAFHSEWLEYIGPGKSLSKKQFEVWRDKADLTYESFEELLGARPGNRGETKIFVQARKTEETGGHAHPRSGLVCLNSHAKSFESILKEIASHGSANLTLMHEVAHIFGFLKDWDIDREGITDLLIAYAMERNQEKLQYGGVFRGADIHWRKTVGEQHRLRRVERASKKYKNNTIVPFNINGAVGSVHDLYVLGLVKEVEWDTFKQVFRSYNDKGFRPNIYESLGSTKIENKPARMRDFLERIEHFSGKPGVLRSLDDNGELFDQYFNVKVVQQNLPVTPSIAKRNDPIRQVQYAQGLDR